MSVPAKNSQMVKTDLYQKIAATITESRRSVQAAVNTALVHTYWEIGRLIVEDEQGGEAHAEYGKGVLKQLSEKLRTDFGKSFSVRNLRYYRQLYLKFPKRNTLCSKLTWSHYRHLIKLESDTARDWYVNEAMSEGWSVRQLERQIYTSYYERRVASKDLPSVIEEARNNLSQLEPIDTIKDPYVLEFLDLQDSARYHESNLEEALIARLQDFLLELGKGYTFHSRQHHLRVEDDDFYIDLVFYNYIGKFFLIIDLKTGKLAHQDIGQLEMYVKMWDDLKKPSNDNPTVGLVLCKQKNNTVVKYSAIGENPQLFTSVYKTVLPTKQELMQQIEMTTELNTNITERQSLEEQREEDDN